MTKMKQWFSSKLTREQTSSKPSRTGQQSAAMQRASRVTSSNSSHNKAETHEHPSQVQVEQQRQKTYYQYYQPTDAPWHDSYFYTAGPGHQSAAIQRFNRGLTSKHHDYGFNFTKQLQHDMTMPAPQMYGQQYFQQPPGGYYQPSPPPANMQYPYPPCNPNQPIYYTANSPTANYTQPNVTPPTQQQQYYGVPTNPYTCKPEHSTGNGYCSHTQQPSELGSTTPMTQRHYNDVNAPASFSPSSHPQNTPASSEAAIPSDIDSMRTNPTISAAPPNLSVRERLSQTSLGGQQRVDEEPEGPENAKKAKEDDAYLYE